MDADEFADGMELRADVCIAGAGAAGITLALRCAAAGLSVLLLESGGERPEPPTQALYEGEVAEGTLHPPLINYRQRRLGGSTSIWGGRCMPLDPIDFERREWIPDSGWPFAFEDLLPYYADANRLCEAGPFAYTASEAFPTGMRPMLPGFAGESFRDDALERFSCPTHFGHRYRRRLASDARIRVVTHANVCNIATDADGGTISHLDCRTLSGRMLTARAEMFVLAAGGLEVPRLLLASRDRHAEGIGNTHDLVGRYYMAHLAGTLGDVRLSNPRSVWHGYERDEEGVYCRRRLALTPAAQRRLRVGNVVARLHHPRIPDPAHRNGILSAIYLAKPVISYEYAKRLHGEDAAGAAAYFGHVRNVVTDGPATARFLWTWLHARTLAERKFPSIIVRSRAGRYSLDMHAEQVPNPDSRVRLTTARDALGMPRLQAEWRSSPLDIGTIRAAMRALTDDLVHGGCGEVRFDPDQVEAEILRDGPYGGHHIGTARMAASPRAGVTDGNGRVHGIANLFVAGSAVFPTSGQANPTLTIVALALRLADHLACARAQRAVPARLVAA